MTMTQAGFVLKARNPDVLTCIANLSNDEVFTPPDFANMMLDSLAEAWASSHDGADIWADPRVTFLDPFAKSGVFLREITKRLTDGLVGEIPDLQDRVDHVLTKQVFGVGITQLTSLLARRSLYCSKIANGPHSVASSFANESGNIWFERMDHTWVGGSEWVLTADSEGKQVRKTTDGKCMYCGASQLALDRGDGLESHAYSFIHTDDVEARIAELFGADMQFDVIIGNPPYQLDTGGSGRQATPIYNLFVDQAKKLEPRLLCMVIPARWFSGGMGLADFRTDMIGDQRLRSLVDYVVDRDAFPNINVNGGICYFVWDRDYRGDCTVTTVAPGGEVGAPVKRSLSEFDIFVRWNEALPILRKVRSKDEDTFDRRVSTISPFGLPTTFHGAASSSAKKPIKLYGSGKVSWVARSELVKNTEWADEWKVFVARATDGNEKFPLPIWDMSGPFVAGPGSACSWTYLVASLAKNEREATYVRDYMRTKFFRFLVALRKPTQDNKADNFSFVPDLKMDRTWTDDALYARYGISDDEADFIESMIRTMEWRSGRE